MTTAGTYLIVGCCTFNNTNGLQGINVAVGSGTGHPQVINMQISQVNTLTTMWVGSISANTSCGINIYSAVARSCENHVAIIRLS